MPISQSGCLFIHIPKCAGTSCEVAMGVCGEYPKIGYEPTSTIRNYKTLFGGGLQHLSVREVKFYFPSRYREVRTSFAIVRHPLDRFSSHLAWKHSRFQIRVFSQSEMREILDVEIAHLKQLASTEPAFENPFMGALYPLENGSLESFDRHLLPQLSLICDAGDISVKKIFDFNNITEIERNLFLNGCITSSFERRMEGDLSAIILSMLREEERRIIQEIYSEDLLFYRSISASEAEFRLSSLE